MRRFAISELPIGKIKTQSGSPAPSTGVVCISCPRADPASSHRLKGRKMTLSGSPDKLIQEEAQGGTFEAEQKNTSCEELRRVHPASRNLREQPFFLRSASCL